MALFHRPLPRTLSAALRDLQEERNTVRRSAIQDLGRYAAQGMTPELLGALIRALGDVDPVVRKEAAYIVGDVQAVEALPQLLMAVEDNVSSVRQAAIDALGCIRDRRSTTRLKRALHDDRADVRFQSLIALARVAPEEGVQAVLQGSSDDDPHVRYIAVRVAEEISSGHEPSDVEATVVLDDRLQQAAHDWLEDEDERVRLAAAILLGRGGDAAGGAMLVDAIDLKLTALEPEDESAAVSLAGSLQLREAIPGLEKRAFGLARLVRERFPWLAMISLARLEHPRARERILRDLAAWTRERRTMAVLAAARAGMIEAIQTIEGLRNDDRLADPQVVDEALGLLHRARAQGGSD